MISVTVRQRTIVCKMWAVCACFEIIREVEVPVNVFQIPGYSRACLFTIIDDFLPPDVASDETRAPTPSFPDGTYQIKC